MLPCLLISGSNSPGRLKKIEEILGTELKNEQNNPDSFILSPELSVGIDEIRSLQKFLQLKPFKENRKIAVILEAQKLTTEAQNSLLKTLEEPPANSFIILAVSELSQILPTIISRCETAELPPESQISLSSEEIEKGIKNFSEILSLGIGKNFVKMEKEGILKDRKTAINFLNSLSLIIRQIMLSKYKNSEKEKSPINLKNYSGKDLVMVLSLIADAVKKLEANCSVRLVLDNFIIELYAKI